MKKINFVQLKKKLFKRKDSTKVVLNAVRDWQLLTIFFIVLNIVILGFHTVWFLDTMRGNYVVTETENSIRTFDTIDQELLADILKQYNQRGQLLDTFKDNRPILVDPGK